MSDPAPAKRVSEVFKGAGFVLAARLSAAAILILSIACLYLLKR